MVFGDDWRQVTKQEASNMSKRGKKAVRVTHDDVERAVAEYQKRGCCIRKLQDEPTPIRTEAAAGRWSGVLWEEIGFGWPFRISA